MRTTFLSRFNSQSRTGCYLSWVFYIVWTKEHSILGWCKVRFSLSAISSQILHRHLKNDVIYLSVRDWTLVDSNVHHNTQMFTITLWKFDMFLADHSFLSLETLHDQVNAVMLKSRILWILCNLCIYSYVTKCYCSCFSTWPSSRGHAKPFCIYSRRWLCFPCFLSADFAVLFRRLLREFFSRKHTADIFIATAGAHDGPLYQRT